ncbi:flagellin [Clostridium beijerinckii]|uniref:Flagellin n=1 Tax=Clostridium beijerinckii TaxID=1520 RepID=A0A1S8S8Q6_CLOBE|nr:flagellin [Clostridium beijerinckii]NRY60030.1 flagellin [Clostridium beijerinckii]OOM61783.1 flagellin [Clostridium beijerinckii]
MRLNHNMYSLSIYKTYKGRITDESKALNNISTGSRLNSAKDNPAKIGKNETLKIQMLTNDAASKNIQDANSMLQTYDGALQGINDNLNRMRELTVSAGSGALTEEDKNNIKAEIESIKKDIDALANNTEFNGIKLSDSSLSGSETKTIKTAIGTIEGESMDIPLFNVSADNLGIGSTLDVSDVNSSLEAIDKATQTVSKIRSKYGSIQNRLEETADYLSSKDINIQTAQSKIGDADIAEEMMNYSKNQLLVNSSLGLMAQSNNFPKDCLNILANVK